MKSDFFITEFTGLSSGKMDEKLQKKVFAIIAAARIIISISSTIVSSALNSPKIKEKFAYSFIFNPAEQKLSLLKKKKKSYPYWKKNGKKCEIKKPHESETIICTEESVAFVVC